MEEKAGINKFKTGIIAVMSFLFLTDLTLLSFFGKKYTETLFFHPIYVHDFLLTVIFLLSFLLKTKGKRIFPIEILIGLAIFYLGYSLLFIWNHEGIPELLILLRQFMIFGYIILLYPIVRAFNSYYSIKKIARVILIVGFAGIIIQFIYMLYMSVSIQTLPFFKKFYLSPVCFFSILIVSAYVLVFSRGILKYLFFALLVLLSFTTGHDSLYLSLFAVFAFDLFLKCSKKQKIMVVTLFLLLCVTLIYTVPQFTNWTSQWRLYYWYSTMKAIVLDNFLIFGSGFGVPYISEVNANEIYDMTLAHGVNYRFDRWITPTHNSFLTLCYHVGIFGVILLLLPLKKAHKFLPDKSLLFLSFCLVGFSFFSFFNVVLELPHLTAIYWLVYFTLVFQLQLKLDNE